MILEETAKQYVKQGVFALAFMNLGMWLGGNVVANLAQRTATKDVGTGEFIIGNATQTVSKAPEWAGPVQEFLTQSVAVFGLCVGGWIVLDYLWGEYSD